MLVQRNASACLFLLLWTEIGDQTLLLHKNYEVGGMHLLKLQRLFFLRLFHKVRLQMKKKSQLSHFAVLMIRDSFFLPCDVVLPTQHVIEKAKTD